MAKQLELGSVARLGDDYVFMAFMDQSVIDKTTLAKPLRLEGNASWADLPWDDYDYAIISMGDGDPAATFGIMFVQTKPNLQSYSAIPKIQTDLPSSAWMGDALASGAIRTPVVYRTSTPTEVGGYPALIFQGGTPAPHSYKIRLTNDEPSFGALSVLGSVDVAPGSLVYASDGVVTKTGPVPLGLVKGATPRRVAGTEVGGPIAITNEGNQIVGRAAPDATFQKVTDLTLTTNVAIQASAGTGLRNYITGLAFDNTGAAAVRVTILDNTTVIFRATVAPGTTFSVQFEVPLRGSAATVVNAALSVAGTVTVSHQGYKGY